MTKPFKFRPTDVSLETQRIIFEEEGSPTQEFAIPDMVLPEDPTERFWALYNKLVELGAIHDSKPIYTA